MKRIISIVLILLSFLIFFSLYVLRNFHLDSTYSASWSELSGLLWVGGILFVSGLLILFSK